MVKLDFECFCQTEWGQNVYVVGGKSKLSEFDTADAIQLTCFELNRWRGTLEIDIENDATFYYRYFISDSHRSFIKWEKGSVRSYKQSSKTKAIKLCDTWRYDLRVEHSWETSAFSEVIFKRENRKNEKVVKGENWIEFKVYCSRVLSQQKIVVVGNIEALGNWDIHKGLTLADIEFPLWKGKIKKSDLPEIIEYKYVIVNENEINQTVWESGSNRILFSHHLTQPTCQVDDDVFRFPNFNLKGAGVSIPVFSIRTSNSFGVGEFTDLKPMADWASGIGLRLIQILPVNDTISTYSFLDSYPYKAISVFALHPLYLNLDKLGKLPDANEVKEYKRLQKTLNDESEIDYLKTLNHKLEYARKAYQAFFETVQKSNDYQQFFTENEEWLVPYAAFSYLRDLEKTSEFSRWKKYSEYNSNDINKLTNPKSKTFGDIAFWYYLQYSLHAQLKEASDYCRSKGIILKGDIPIGISRTSVDAWCQPELYHFDGQAGAPPDDFSVDGQNWGFPTYNWEVMAKDGYKWWRTRLTNMAHYFDAYRIDHILGFFRIWEIPYSAIQGILGHFRPSYTITFDELHHRGIWVDFKRLCTPYIREHHLQSIFGEHAQFVRENYLDFKPHGEIELKKGFRTQREIYNQLVPAEGPEAMNETSTAILNGLLKLAADVVFIPVNESNTEFYPRISMHSTNSFIELDPTQKHRLDLMYIDYFYHRHESFWKEKATEKLPALVNATNMLVCGEDLGMIPASVPQVMRDLGILSLEIQRMPKDPKQDFAHPADAPYLSVCTTSTHDMSTIRGWWEENRRSTQKFYNQQLGQWGEMPYFAEPWVCKLMIEQHLYSNAMWTIFPLQDLLAMSAELRFENPHAERINEPANPRHYWRYRMHLSVEELKKSDEFNALLKDLIEQSGRKINT